MEGRTVVCRIHMGGCRITPVFHLYIWVPPTPPTSHRNDFLIYSTPARSISLFESYMTILGAYQVLKGLWYEGMLWDLNTLCS